MQENSNFDKVETAANIYIRFFVNGESFEVPVSDIDLTKDVDVERVREMGLYPDGYAINAIDIDGSLSFAGNLVRLPNGNHKDLDELLFHEDGEPRVFDITVVHHHTGEDTEVSKSETDTIQNVIVTSSEFSASSGETTESSYEFMAQRVE